MPDRSPLALRRFALVAVVLPIAISVVALVAQAFLLPPLPDPVATHWGLDGRPDGFGPAWVNLVLTVVVGLGIPLVIAASGLGGLRRGDHGGTYRLLGATALAMSVLMAVIGTGALALQAGLTDAANAPGIGLVTLGAFVLAGAAGVLGWFLQPHEPFRAMTLPAGDPLTLSGTEKAVWLQRVSLARSGVIVLGAAFVLIFVVSVVALSASPEPFIAWLLVGVMLVMAATFATTLAFHVRVDDDGLRVTSVTGFPRVHIPLDEIARAEAVEVNPMGEFGGWGLRWAPGGGFGVVLRRGPGIRVTRTNGKTFTVTVDDAETGAALLQALATRVG